MILYTGRIESIRIVTQLTGMIFLFPLTPRSTTVLNQALVAHFRLELCQIRGGIIKRPVRGVFLLQTPILVIY